MWDEFTICKSYSGRSWFGTAAPSFDTGRELTRIAPTLYTQTTASPSCLGCRIRCCEPTTTAVARGKHRISMIQTFLTWTLLLSMTLGAFFHGHRYLFTTFYQHQMHAINRMTTSTLHPPTHDYNSHISKHSCCTI